MGSRDSERSCFNESQIVNQTKLKLLSIPLPSTREYFHLNPASSAEPAVAVEPTSVRPTGLIAASTSYEVNNQLTTEHTVQQFRTYVDGKYAHLVSTISNVYSDPPAAVHATPIYRPVLSRAPKEYPLPGELNIKPSKSRHRSNGIVTRTVGGPYRLPKLSKALKLEDLIEAESKRTSQVDDSLNLIQARSIQAEEGNEIDSAEVVKHKEAVPTFTVDEDGVLNIPPPSVEVAVAENEIEPTLAPHRFSPGRGEVVEATKTMLDSVTYVGFVDFTTTIDDTVVIFRPKKTYSTATRNILQLQNIQPTQTQENRFTPASSAIPFHPQQPILRDSKQPPETSSPSRSFELFSVRQPDIDSSLPESHRTSGPTKATPSVEPVIPRHTSGINPLKSLLEASRLARLQSKSTAQAKPSSAQSSSASISPSSTLHSSSANNRPRITLNPGFKKPSLIEPSTPEIKRPHPPPEPNEIASSFDTDSDVELVYKTLYTTYTYFTTFFRASTTR